MPAPPLRKIGDFPHPFPTFDPDHPGTCRIRLHASARPVPECRAVIIISQAAGSIGSVTNFIEEIATEVLRTIRARPEYARVFRSVQSGTRTESQITWIEHHPPGTAFSATEERFCRVRFQPAESGRLFAPQWQVISRLHLEQSLLRTRLTE